MHEHDHDSDADGPGTRTVVLETAGLQWATEKNVVESTLGRLPGVHSVDVNPVAQSATVTFDPSVSSVAALRESVEECGYYCAGQSVPKHVCLPMAEPTGPDHADSTDGAPAHPAPGEHGAKSQRHNQP